MLETPVKLWQIEEEFAALLGLYVAVAPMRVLEIGTYEGGSLWHWLRLADTHAHVVSVDLRLPALTSFAYNASRHTHIQGNSTDPSVIDRVNTLGPFNWVFIDGGHDYDTVSADWLNYGQHATWCAFHDIAPHDDVTIGVRPLWFEIEGEKIEFVKQPALGWGGIGVVRN